MELDEYTTKLAELNPCIKFIVDNYELLCRVYPGRVVMTMNAPGMVCFGAPGADVVKTFDNMIAASLFTQAMDMGQTPYAMKLCDGSDVWNDLTYSIGCNTPN